MDDHALEVPIMLVREPPDALPPSAEAQDRFLAVSLVLAREQEGDPRSHALAHVASERLPSASGTSTTRPARRRAARTLERWVKAYETHGIAGLEPERRRRCETSQVLPAAFLDFLREQKKLDPKASFPEIILRARELEIVDPDVRLDRATVWRAARRMGLSRSRRKRARDRDSRRYAWPHRLDLVIADGKHFRVGQHRARRVAIFFIDDATRYALHVVVGTSENAELFVRGLYDLVRQHGLFSRLYVDHGPGFIALDTIEVVRKLGALLIHGETAYPEGHGKVERFNRTALAAVLRNLDGRADVDPDCSALELRLGHYLREVYNHSPHSSLGGDTPAQRFIADTRALRLPPDDADLRRRFIVIEERTVSNDHVVSFEGTNYEVPCGLAGHRVDVHRQVLDGRLYVEHQQRLVEIHPVDLAHNAGDRRGRQARSEEPDVRPLPPTAAEMLFQREHAPVVDEDGGFSDTVRNES